MTMAVARISSVSGSGSISAVPALLVALLACATAMVAAAAAGSPCDGAICGMGTCREVPAPIPQLQGTFVCDCHPGWSQPFTIFPDAPCTVPTCPSSKSCFNFTLPVPKAINFTDPCVVVDCGSQGTCVKEEGLLKFHCQCNQGAVNMLNIPSLPCMTNCVIGEDGCLVKVSPPPPPPPSSPAPPGNHESSGPTAAPSSTKGNNATSLGSVSSQNLLLLLLLASLAAVQVV